MKHSAARLLIYFIILCNSFFNFRLELSFYISDYISENSFYRMCFCAAEIYNAVCISFVFSDDNFVQTRLGHEQDQKRLRDRFWRILVDSPHRGATFDRIYNFYSESNEIDQLINKGVELSQQLPNKAEPLILLGLIYERCGDIEKGINAYRQAIKIDANNSLAFYYLGEMLIVRGKLREAISMLENSVKNKPNKNELRSILLLLGKTAERLGDSKKADNVWNKLVQLYPNNPEIIITITNILESEGRIDEAVKRYEQYLKNKTDDYTFVRLKLAVIALKIRQSKEFSPVDNYTELLDKLDSDSWIAEIVRKRLEQFFAERDNFNGLVDFYKNRLKKYPNEPATILQLANLLVKLERKTETIELLELSITKFPNNISLRLAIIDLYITKNQIDNAIEQYQKIDAIKPADKNYLIGWGELVLKTNKNNKREETAKIWSRLVELSPDDPMSAIRAAELAARHEIIDLAEKFYKYAITLRPDDAAFREYLGIFYYRQAEIKKAIETIQSIAEDKRKNAESLIHAGSLLRSIQAEKEAFSAFSNAVKLAPENAIIRWKYIESLIRKGEIDNAVMQLIETDKLIKSDDEFDVFLRNEIRFVKQNLQTEKILKILSDKISTDNFYSDSSNDVTKNQIQRLYWRLAVYNQSAGKSEAAVKNMDNAIEFSKNIIEHVETLEKSLSLRILQAAAELYKNCSAVDKAVKILHVLAAQDGVRQISFIRQLAVLQIRTGDKESAAQTINRLLEFGTVNSAIIAQCAELLHDSERIEDAINLLRRGLRSNHNDLLLQKMLSEYSAKNRQFKEAIEVARRHFERTENIEIKMQIAKEISEYYLAIESENSSESESKIPRKLNDDHLSELLFTVRNSADKRTSILCAATAFEVLSDYISARSELEGFLITANYANQVDKLLLKKLVNVTEKLQDYESAVKYQELICRNSKDPTEFDKLFVLYDLNNNSEKCSQLFMQQILNKTNVKDQISMIDRMIGREEYEAVDHVLAFFEIHEEPNWEIMYRQVAVAAYRKQKNLSELVRNFRKQNFIDNENNKRNEYLTGERLIQYLDDRFNNLAWKLPLDLPTKDFTIWEIDDNNNSEMLSIFRQQEIFLLTLYRERLQRNKNYRTFNNKVFPKPFYSVNNLEEARFLVLCWLLRDQDAEKIINDNNPSPEEIKKLKALQNSCKLLNNG
ncbi:MAG: tetratricopeptide repeat protein [Planctomycetaceae bacterium]|jgi:tetratricopeptide (TPR) repeat protein|nr:tetratricopeptide repeat protein [Planctomycetaceae bacterium]